VSLASPLSSRVGGGRYSRSRGYSRSAFARLVCATGAFVADDPVYVERYETVIRRDALKRLEEARASLEQLAEAVGADRSASTTEIAFRIRERIREGDRYTARMRKLETRIEAARKALEGET
jgi:single-stranded DNA-specific DHH superfamily exonuclease